jgi:2'-5' RNA ligase
MPIESALVVLIPEAETMIETFRERLDPSAGTGLPAHVTILYPFKSPDELTPETIKTLREIFSKIPSFSTSFLEVKRFPDTLFLMPVPDEPFRQLTETIARSFPDSPPYGGAFVEVVPHLTITQGSDAEQLDKITADFNKAASGKLPIQVKVDTVTLMENSGETWQVREQFFLNSNQQPTKE